MLLLRILTLPIAVAALAVLYTASIKAPHIVETVNLALWLVLPLILIAKLCRRRA